MRRLPRVVLVFPLLIVAVTSCVIVRSRTAEVTSVAKTTQRITTPVKVYLTDGSIVLFRDGTELRNDTLWGTGASFGSLIVFPDSIGRRSIARVPIDSVAALESVQLRTNEGMTLAGTMVGSFIATIGAAALWAVIFGSCPTVYSDSAGQQVLDAEIFANRISALFEARDLDLLKAKPDADGIVRLQVRNEALETHYINVMEVLETVHAPGETVVLDERGKPIAVRDLVAPARAIAGDQRNVLGEVRATDGVEFMTSLGSMASTTDTAFNDHIDLVFPNAGPGETALTLRLRNSVLNSVLLYDVIMNEQGLRAVDWLGVYMERIGDAVQFARWHHTRFGLRVHVWRNGAYEEVARHPTYGPIAWREVATMLPRVEGDSLRVRLTFVKDDWRIDRVSLARNARRLPVKRIQATRVTQADGHANTDALTSLHHPDQKYVLTYPGQRFDVEYRVNPKAAGTETTYLLASHGFYTEWVRGEWIRKATPTTGFKPGDDAIVKSIERWRDKREKLTTDFFGKRVPVI